MWMLLKMLIAIHEIAIWAGEAVVAQAHGHAAGGLHA
jgi:hypothetical protein